MMKKDLIKNFTVPSNKKRIIKKPLIFGLSEDIASYDKYKNCIN